MYAIEKAKEMNWHNVWLESDSQPRALNQNVDVPWCLSNMWKNCKNIAKSLNCLCIHIFRDRN